MGDPYVYPGTVILRNKLNLRDPEAARDFEIAATSQRMAEGIPRVALTVDGYRNLHRHIFQDVYERAGQLRTVDLSKPGALFCKVEHIVKGARQTVRVDRGI